jgi:hypothetical protein
MEAKIDSGKTYYVSRGEYGKIVVDGKMLMPLKPDANKEWPEGEQEIGCVVRAVFDGKLGTPKVEIIKRVSRESQIVYG